MTLNRMACNRDGCLLAVLNRYDTSSDPNVWWIAIAHVHQRGSWALHKFQMTRPLRRFRSFGTVAAFVGVFCFVRRNNGTDALLVIRGNDIAEYNVQTRCIERTIRIACASNLHGSTSGFLFPNAISCAGDAIVVGYCNRTINVYSYSRRALRCVVTLSEGVLNSGLGVPSTLSADGSRLFLVQPTGCPGRINGFNGGISRDIWCISSYCTATGVHLYVVPGSGFCSPSPPVSLLLCADDAFVVAFGDSVCVLQEAGNGMQKCFSRPHSFQTAGLVYAHDLGILTQGPTWNSLVVLKNAWMTCARRGFVCACLYV